MRTLPHDDYIEAIEEALKAGGLEPEQVDVRDDETRGTHMYLDAVLTLTAETSGIDPGEWDHGLILVWEWHTGLDEDERGPSWQWARLNEDGSNWPLQPMAVYGYASPAAVVTVTRQILTNPRSEAEPALGVWDHAEALDAACEAWAKE
jgi:hypothetical protein